MNRLFRLSAVLALVASFVLPMGALAVDPSPSPSPSPSESPTAATTVTDAELPVPDADLLESIPVTLTGGRIGSSLSPAALIFTDVDTKGGVVRITNPTDRLLVISVRVRDYTVDANGVVAVDENGEPTTGVPNYQYSSGDWYTFAYTDFLLPAGRQINLPFTLAVPAAAAPGDHTAALVVTARAARMDVKPGEVGITISSQFRFLLRLQHRVAGAQSAAPSVKVNALVDGSNRIDLVATVDNEGTTVLDYKPYVENDPIPFFRIKAKNSGELIRTFDVVKGFYVLPEGNRIISVSWRAEDVTEPTGSAAEIARLKADEKIATDREQLGLIRAKIELAEARAAYAAATAKLEPVVVDVVAALRDEMATWYATQDATLSTPVPAAVVQAKLDEVVAATAQSSKLAVSVLTPLATLAAADAIKAAFLQMYADTAALPYTGDYIVEFVLPKKGGLEEIVTSAEFSFVNADPTKTLADSAPFALILIALLAGGCGLVIAMSVLRRRRSEDISAE